MPVYEYECDACKKIVEVQQRMTDAPLTQCLECGGHLRKLISMSSFQLKGSGWYADGYSCKPDSGSCCASEGKSESPCAAAASCCSQCPASA